MNSELFEALNAARKRKKYQQGYTARRDQAVTSAGMQEPLWEGRGKQRYRKY